jgi:hypothetical protein
MNTPLVLLLVLVGQTQPGPVAPENADTKAEAEEARAVAKKVVGEYEFKLDKSSETKLELDEKPVLRWLLQLDRRFYSDVYVWTHEGRPEVVAAITNVYGGRRRAMETEIHSLSTGLPLLSHEGNVVWEPERPGVQFNPIPDATKPSAGAGIRLKQMRDLAAEYAVTAEYGKQKEELRLLTTPLYRYASPKQGVTDGALFAFARGTDPEVFLMIEARKVEEGLEWQSALARFVGHASLRVLHDDREIWQVDVLPTNVNLDPKQPYFAVRKYSDFPVVK